MNLPPFVTVQCPNCGKTNRIPSERAGERASCGKCHYELSIADHNSTYADHGLDREYVSYANVASASQTTTPTIAIIGTEGSGKTVLVTSLAKQFCHASASGIFLNPSDNNTLRFVERNWQTLCSGEWPAGSPLGTMQELRWRLELSGDSPFECDLRIVDSAGQDLRRLFSNDEPSAAANLPSHLQNLEAYCKSAEIVICLINLGDFLGESDAERRLDNQIVIKSALQRLAADPARRLCLLFTQADRYPSILTQEGELSRVVDQVLPYVRGVHLAKGQKQVILRMVAAVNKSVVIVDPDGRPRRVPAPNFESFGFDGLMGWLVKEVRAIAAVHQAERARQAAIQQSLREAEFERKHQEQYQRENQIAAAVAASVVVLGIAAKSWVPITILVLGLVAWWWTRPPAPRLLPVQQRSNFFSSPSKVAAWIEYGRFNNDISLRNGADRTLKELIVTLVVRRNGTPIENKRLRGTDLPAGAIRTWRNIVSVSKIDELAVTVDSYRW